MFRAKHNSTHFDIENIVNIYASETSSSSCAPHGATTQEENYRDTSLEEGEFYHLGCNTV
jgi:hypothetical protein